MASFHLYGFFIGLGIVVGILVVEKIRKKFPAARYQIPVNYLLPWVVIFGLVGARLYHVVDYWQYYSENLLKVFYLWQGGMGIYGAVVGGFVGLWIFLKLKTKTQNSKFSKIFLSYLDLISFGLPVGQAIGRLGNYFNQELYGLPTNLSWGIYISLKNRVEGFAGYEYFHPLFFYEAIWNLAIFIILIKIASSRFKVPRQRAGRQGSRWYKQGTFFFIYLCLYGFGRFWLEFLRINPWKAGGIDIAQGISLGLVVIGLVGLIRRI